MVPGRGTLAEVSKCAPALPYARAAVLPYRARCRSAMMSWSVASSAAATWGRCPWCVTVPVSVSESIVGTRVML